jgi:muramoyltetrapeptide carboxypeptidase LdcA involved in peptidoglycan recycling
VLLNAIYAHTRQVSYHGIDLIWGLGKNAGEYTINHLKDFLFNGSLNYSNHKDYPKWKVIKSGKATGVCLGGCLPSFCLLLGTDGDPIKVISEPFILIVESIGESSSRIESYIAQIFQQPNFKKYCSGIIVGHFFMCGEQIPENNRGVSDIVLDYGKKYNFPVIEIMELGHAVENMIFPIGGQLSFDANNALVTITANLGK